MHVLQGFTIHKAPRLVSKQVPSSAQKGVKLASEGMTNEPSGFIGLNKKKKRRKETLVLHCIS
jgi:hypothetical protein